MYVGWQSNAGKIPISVDNQIEVGQLVDVFEWSKLLSEALLLFLNLQIAAKILLDAFR